MALAAVKTFSSGEVLTATDLNALNTNILNNALSLISPLTGSLDCDGNSLTLDAAAATSVVSSTAVSWNFTSGSKTGTPATTGSVANWSAQTFTDNATSGSGTAASYVAYAIQRPTLAATNASVTTTNASTLYIANAPAAGTNETLTNAYALWIDDGRIRFDPSATVVSAASATLDALNITAQTATISGSTNITTATGVNFVNIGQPTLSAASALTVTNAASLYIAAAPTGAGAGPATITNAYAIWADAGTVRFDGDARIGGSFVDSSDETKKATLVLSGVATATTRTITMPDANVDLQYARAASDTVAGGMEIATQAEQETGTDSTRAATPGRQHFHPGHPKCWLSYDQATPGIISSYNITSVTDTGTGVSDVTISTDFSAADWTPIVSCRNTPGGAEATTVVAVASNANFAAGTVRLQSNNVSDGGNFDVTAITFVGLGDQA